MATQVEIINAALELVSDQTYITALNDGSPAADAATVVYPIVRDLLLRVLNPAFARLSKALVLTGDNPIVPPYAYSYVYPADCIRVRRVRPPPSGANAPDPNDPLPVRAAVAFDATGGGAKVIGTNQVEAWAVYTSNAPGEALWSPTFVDAMVRRLGNPLAMALSGKPEFSRELLEESERYAAIANENREL